MHKSSGISQSHGCNQTPHSTGDITIQMPGILTGDIDISIFFVFLKSLPNWSARQYGLPYLFKRFHQTENSTTVDHLSLTCNCLLRVPIFQLQSWMIYPISLSEFYFQFKYVEQLPERNSSTLTWFSLKDWILCTSS